MTFYHPFPLLGMVVSEHGAAEICVDVTEMLRKHMYDLIARKYCHKMGASSIQYSVYFYITRTDYIYATVPGDAFYYSDDVHCHPVSRSPSRHGVPSPSVSTSSYADRRFFLRPAAEPMTYSGRPPRPSPHRRPSSAVQPRYVSSILTNLSDILYRITI